MSAPCSTFHRTRNLCTRVYLSGMRTALTILLLNLFMANPHVQAINTDSLLSLYGSQLANHKEFQADFTQSRYLEMFGKPLISKGVLYFRAPSSFKLHYTSPFESVILFNGKKLQRFILEDGKYVEQPSMEIVAKAISREMIRWLSGTFDKDFPYKVNVESANPRRLELIPDSKMARAVFASIILHMADPPTYISSIRLNEPSGDYILIEHQQPDFSSLPQDEFQITSQE